MEIWFYNGMIKEIKGLGSRARRVEGEKIMNRRKVICENRFGLLISWKNRPFMILNERFSIWGGRIRTLTDGARVLTPGFLKNAIITLNLYIITIIAYFNQMPCATRGQRMPEDDRKWVQSGYTFREIFVDIECN